MLCLAHSGNRIEEGMMRTRSFTIATMIGVLSGCNHYENAPPVPTVDSGITLEEGACFGTCPIYTMSIYPNEFYELDAGRFTVNPGESTGALPAGSWAAANTALQTANFATLPTDVTPGNPACGGGAATDLPRAAISEMTIAGTRTVNYYRGCFQAPDKQALDLLIDDLRIALDVDNLVIP